MKDLENEFRVYALIDHTNNKIFYVGSSRQFHLCKRKANHIEDAKKGIQTKKCDIIRKCNYSIQLIILFEGIGNKEFQIEKEQFFIDIFKPIGNISGARSVPPKMGGHNKVEISQEIYDQLGKIPDYKLGNKYNLSKEVIMRARKENSIPSYAQSTGNDGRMKKGEVFGTKKGFYSKFNDEIDVLLGTMPDKKIAERFNIHHSTIFQRRKKLNIASFGSNNGRNKKSL